MRASDQGAGFRLALRYAFYDLRSGVSALFLLLSCLSLGIAGIAAVQNLSHNLTVAIQADGQRILGGDVAFLSNQPLPADIVAAAGKLGRASAVVETRSMVINTANQHSALVDLKAVDNAYPLFGVLELADGMDAQVAFKPQERGRFGAVAESGLADKLGIRVGDSFRLGDADLVLTGIIAKEPDRVAGIGFILAPRLIVPMAALDQSGLAGLGSRSNYSLRVALVQPADAEAQGNAFRARFPKADFRVRSYTNASPQTARVIERLTLFLTLTGLSTLLIGGIGIGNAVRSFLDPRRARIAVFKSLGASASFVFQVCALQIFFLSLAGIAAGLALGLIASHVAGQILGPYLGLRAVDGFDPAVVALSAGFGFLTTALFSLPPLLAALATKPSALFRDRLGLMTGAMTHKSRLVLVLLALTLAALAVATAPVARFAVYFCLGAAFVCALFYGAARLAVFLLGFLSPSGRPALRLGLANITRAGGGALSLALSLGLGLTVLIAMADVESNFGRMLKNDLTGDRPSFYFLDVTPQQKESFVAAVQGVSSARSLHITPNLRGRITAVNDVPAEQALVNRTEEWVTRSDRSFTYTDRQPAHSVLTEGVWWPADYKGPEIVSISTDVARAFDIGIGDELTITILGRPVAARVYNVRAVDWSSFAMNFAVTFAPGALTRVPATYLATVTVDQADEAALQSRLAQDFPNVTSIRVREALDVARGLVATVAAAVRYGAALTLVSGLLVLAGSIAAARRRHVYDAVVLKVLGAERLTLAAVFLVEYGTIGLIAAVLAAVLGAGAGYAVLHFILDLPWAFFPGPLIVTAGLCLMLTLLAGFAGTFHALSQSTARYLRNG